MSQQQQTSQYVTRDSKSECENDWGSYESRQLNMCVLEGAG